MANLEEHIAAWRRELAEALGGSAETVEELEGHLRDEVARLVQEGRTPDDAFATAVARLGRPPALAAEFARLGPAAPWLPVRVALVVLIAGAGWLFGILTPRLLADADPLLGVHVIAVTLGYSTTLVVGVLAACYVVARPFGVPGPRQVQGLVRATTALTAAASLLTALGITLGAFWAQEHWGRFWTWDAKEIAASLVLSWDVAMLVVLTRRALGEHATLLLGLAGNAVVALAWFGPAVLGLGLRSYGMPSLALPLAAFVAVQVGLACVGMLPAGAWRRRRAA